MRNFLLAILAGTRLFGAALHPLPVPVTFESNRGQAPASCLLLGRAPGQTVELRAGSVHLHAGGGEVRVAFPGSRPSIPAAESAMPAFTNYLLGNDPGRWITGVPHWERARYPALYPGVDLLFHGAGPRLEYDFLLSPGADSSAIRLRLTGGGRLNLTPAGDLEITLPGATLRMHRPVAMQDGRRIRAAFQLAGYDLRFSLGPYDHRRALTIDPVLSFSTFLGGSNAEGATAVATDVSGNTWVAGATASTDFPLSGALQAANAGTQNAFVSKFSPAGALLYSTYLGGSGSDIPSGIAVDSAGNIVIAGTTSSANFPLRNPLQSALNGPRDAFLTRLNSSGSALLFSTYYGGSQAEQLNDMALDAAGFAYLAGTTSSTDLPTLLPLQAANAGGTDAFVAKINVASGTLAFATYLGGSANDNGRGLAVDPSANVYVTGDTASTNFPVTAALQPALAGGIDAFVSKFSTTGGGLLYSTFLGGAGTDTGRSIALDISGNAYVAGDTSSPNFPVASAFQPALAGVTNAFLVKLNPAASALVYGTFLGGAGTETGQVAAVDSAGNAYVAGSTNSTNFPVVSPLQPASGGAIDAFVTEFNPAGNAVLFSTYLGGSGNDYAIALALDSYANMLLAGSTSSGNFPAPGAIQPSLHGTQDAFVARILQNGPSPFVSPLSLSFPGAPVGVNSSPLPVTLTNLGSGILNIASVQTTGDFSQTNNCGASLNSGGACTLSVTFTGAAAGPRTGGLMITDNAPGSPRLISLNGLATAAAPQLTSAVNPPSLPPGSPAASITLNGSGFVPGATVNWNGAPLPTTYAGPGRLTAVIPAANLASPSGASLTVTNPVQTAPAITSRSTFLTGAGRGVTVSQWPSANLVLYNREDSRQCDQVHGIRPDGSGDICLTCGIPGFGGGIAFHNGKLSPDGKWIALQVTVASSFGCASSDGAPGSGNNQEIWLASYPNLAANQTRVSPACMANRCGALIPLWNYQQSQIAYGSRQVPCVNPGPPDCPMQLGIATLNFSSAPPSVVNTFVNVNGGNPGVVEPWSWRPDGTAIYYTGHDATHPYPSYVVNSFNLTNNNVATLTPWSSNNAWNEFPTFAPNGQGFFLSSSRTSPSQCNLPGCPPPIFPLDEIGFLNPGGSSYTALTGLNIPGYPDYAGGAPIAANGITVSPDGTRAMIDEEIPNAPKWIAFAALAWPLPAVVSNAVPFLVTQNSAVTLGRIDLAAGSAPWAVLSADFTGDGKADLAATNRASGTVSLLLGNGDGTFTPHQDFAAGSGPAGLITGDFNGDGKPDLAVANSGSATVSILLGAGNGTFLPHQDYAANSGAIALAAADFNSDGRLDLAVANPGSGTVSILLGNGDGTFAPRTDLPAGSNPTALALGDLNGDGNSDLVLVNTAAGSSSLTILLGNGDGSFRAPQSIAAGNSASAAVIADMDGDGVPDLIVTNAGSATLSIFRGNGDGSFRPRSDFSTGNSPNSVVIADFSGDGKLDAAVANTADNTVSVLLGSGDGTLQPHQDFPAGAAPRGLTLAGFRNDGRLDLATANSGAATLSALPQSPLVIAPLSVNFGNQVYGSSSAAQAVTLQNVSQSPVALNSFAISGDFTQTNNCPPSLVPGAACTAQLVFLPSAMGARAGALTITSSSAAVPAAVMLSGNGAPPPFSISLGANPVAGGNPVPNNSVVMTAALPIPLTFALASSNAPAAAVPGSVTIPAGQTSIGFNLTTSSVLSPTLVTISASAAGVTQVAGLNVYPAALYSLNLSPATLYGGLSGSGAAYLTANASQFGASISLTSSNPSVAAVPSTVNIAAGANGAAFPFTTAAVSSPASVTFTANYGTVTKTATLTVLPAVLYGVTLNPATIGGGLQGRSNQVSLAGSAPPGGAVVALSSSNPAVASVPSSVTVAANSAVSPVFAINTTGVTANTPVTITAAYAGQSKTASLTVAPPSLYSVTLTSATVKGGGADSGLAILNGVAPAGGLLVSLSSSNPSVAGVPASITIPANASSASYNITTTAQTATQAVTITAAYAGGSRSVTLNVTP